MKIIDISNCSDGVIAYINNLQKYIDEKEKEIQDLKQKNDYLNDLEASAVEYKELQNQLQQKENMIKEVREELEYTIPIVEHNKTITKHLKEIERLNNIINELEKWLQEKQILYGINQQGFSWGVCGEALDKLQELKGSDK